MKNYKDILTSKNTIFTIIIVVGLGLLIGLVIHQEHIQAERGNIALSKQHKDGQDVEQVKNAIKNFNIDSETIIEDWKKIQELKPTSDEGKKTLADFLTSTADKITNHYTEKALKLDIKESDSQFEDKQALETAITSLQKIIEIIKSVNSTSEQATIDEKIKPIQELISKFQKQVEVLTKKEEQKSNKKKQKRLVTLREEKAILQKEVATLQTILSQMGTDIIHKHLQASNIHLMVLEVGETLLSIHEIKLLILQEPKEIRIPIIIVIMLKFPMLTVIIALIQLEKLQNLVSRKQSVITTI